MKTLLFITIIFSTLLFKQCEEEKIPLLSKLKTESWKFPGNKNNRFPITANRVVKILIDTVTNRKVIPSIDTLYYYLCKVKEAGFNLVTVNLTPSNNSVNTQDKYYYNFFNALEKVNSENDRKLRCIVYDYRLRSLSPDKFSDFVSQYYSREEIYGFSFDEPRQKEFSHIKEWMDFTTNRLTDKMKSKLYYVNLFSIKAEQEYRRYLYSWINKANPRILSFDHYALWDDKKANEYGYALNSDWINDYFLNFEFIRQTALKVKIPFCNWILIHKHWSDYSKLFYRRSGKEDLRFQVFSALAYGSKGIFYYNFWNAPIKSDWNEEEGILDYKLKETNLYFEVKSINDQLSIIGNTLLNLTSIGVYHKNESYYDNNIISDTKKAVKLEELYDKDSEGFKKEFGIKLIDWNDTNKLYESDLKNKFIYEIDNSAALVGLFIGKNGSRYFLIVNKNRKKREEFRIVIYSTKIPNNNNLSIIEVATNLKINASEKRSGFISFTINLNAGSGKLFLVE